MSNLALTPKDFFVSYIGQDRSWAEWIAWVLEEAGYTVVIQAWDFKVGSNFVLDMQQATIQANRTIAVISSLYLNQPFPQSEWAAAFAVDPTSQNHKLIPIRVEDCHLPGLLRQIVYVDIFDCVETEGQQRLLVAVQEERMKPIQRPQFPGKSSERQVPDHVPFPGTPESARSTLSPQEAYPIEASGEYSQRYQKRHGTFKVLGMSEPINLEKVYTTVQFLNKQGIKFSKYPSNDFTQEELFQMQNWPKKEGIQVANAQQYLMVLGGPGAGKSTFLRRVGLEALKGNQGDYKHNKIPVFIELKTFNEGDIDLLQAITKELENCRFPNLGMRLTKLLESGQFLLLLDGLDEVAKKRCNRVIELIHDFVNRYDQNHFICSCRTAARQNLQGFTDVQLADFNDAQISQFIIYWFSSAQDQPASMAQDCWQMLQHRVYQRAKELAQTPLLLTFLCLTYEAYQAFPKNRAELYYQALDILLRRWAAERRIHRDPIYKDLSIRREEIMLAKIAYTSFKDDRRLFHRRDISDEISDFLSKSLNAPKHLDSDQVLREIEIQQGILVERNPDILSFSHLTLQEYLTAQHIADDHNQLSPLVKKHLIDERWREVFLLLAGLVRPTSDQLLTLMEEQAQSFLTNALDETHIGTKYLVHRPLLKMNPQLQRLISWANQVTTGSRGNYHPVAKRVVAIALVRTLSLARTLNHALINNEFNRYRSLEHTIGLHLTRAHALNYAFDLHIKIDFNLIRTFALNLARTLTRTIDFDRACVLAHTFEQIQIFKTIDFRQLSDQLKTMKNEIPDQNQPPQVWRTFKTKIWKLWLETLKWEEQWLNLSDAEENALQNYLYACELIVQCKESAGEVSPLVWEEIEKRILTILS